MAKLFTGFSNVKSIHFLSAAALAGAMYAAACSSSSSSTSSSGPAPMMAASMSMNPPSPDPRIGLRAGKVVPLPRDTTKRMIVEPAAEAIWNLRLLSNSPPPEPFIGQTNSDLAFTGKYAIQGNYDGYQVWDISNPRKVKTAMTYVCRGSQSDVSVFRNLLFVSGEATTGRVDCGLQGVTDSVSHDRFRGVRVFKYDNIADPKYVASVQTCRGSHTHTVVVDPKDDKNVYIYVSGSSSVRPAAELPGCLAAPDDPNTSLFRIEVIQVPVDAPEKASIVGFGKIFQDLGPRPMHADPPDTSAGRGGRAGAAGGRGGRGNADTTAGGRAGGGGRGGRGGGNAAPALPPGMRPGPNQCHDITVYPAIGLAGGACGGYGLLLDVRDVKNPKRLDAAADSNMSFWHSATFSNDGSKILFSDEWGGGRGARCRPTDKMEWGANALFTIVNNKMQFKSYYKMPAAQTSQENCVAHNGSLIPIPGREIMVQAWYQGGISVFDWTDPSKPKEIAFHDRGPTDASGAGPGAGGSWSVYWYNGVLVSSEIARGLDVFELVPSPHISQNEIDAANTVHFDYLNVQGQQKIVWPPSFALARAYVDQLERSHGLSADRISVVRASLAAAEKASGKKRKDALAALGTQLSTDAASSSDQAKVRMLASAVGDLAK
jgi:hypothetical protein